MYPRGHHAKCMANQVLVRFGVARKASLDLLKALPGVRRAALFALAGVFAGVDGAGIVLIFFAERGFSRRSSFSLSEDSWTVSSLRFVLATMEGASLLRTMRIVPVVVGPVELC